jgi:hypothetical protein
MTGYDAIIAQIKKDRQTTDMLYQIDNLHKQVDDLRADLELLKKKH